MSEEELILALKNHTRAGAEALYDTYAVCLYRVILGRVKNEELAERLLLEVIQEIWQEAGSYDAVQSRLAVWIMAITRRITRAGLRSH